MYLKLITRIMKKIKFNILIQISGLHATKKHSVRLNEYIMKNFSEPELVFVETIINKESNFNICLNNIEIFSKRRFWNKYPNYKTIVNKIENKRQDLKVFAAMKAAYDFNNELF